MKQEKEKAEAAPATETATPASRTVELPNGVKAVLAETEAIISAQNGRRTEALRMFLFGMDVNPDTTRVVLNSDMTLTIEGK